LILLGGSFLFISSLNDEIKEIQIDKETQLSLLSEKEDKLQTQNKLYSMQINSKVKDIEELSSQLDELHNIIGIKKDDTKSEITQKTLKAIDNQKKKYTLKVIPSGIPVESNKISSNFGYRINPITNKKQFHRGIDIPAPRKTPIRATADGVVEFVQSKNIGDYGRVIKIIHNYGFKTIYGHMFKTYPNAGDIVKKGQIIGLVGSSGRSTAPHLHYEVSFVNNILNPKNFMNWSIKNYDEIFKKERRVEWESLISLINSQQETQLR
jgi:murein DD-endopeptidase MepM/ murein hydrolase activator NlpD